MTRETKVGLLMVTMLVGVFGFMVYKKMYRPAGALAEQNDEVVSSEEQPDAPPFATGRDSTGQWPKANSRVIPAAASAPARIPDEAASVQVAQREADPFELEEQPKPRTTTKLPTSIPNDAAFFDASPKKTTVVERREPAATAPTTNGFDPFASPEKSSSQANPSAARSAAASVPVGRENDDPFEAPVEIQQTPPRRVAPQQGAQSQSEFDPFDTTPQTEPKVEKTPTLEPPPRKPVSLPTEVIDSFMESKPSTPTMKSPALEPVPAASSSAPVGARSLEATADEDRFGGFRPAATNAATADPFVNENRTAGSVTASNEPFGAARRPAPAARIDEDFAPRSSSQPLIAGETYAIEPNDNFWTISRKKYGTGRYFMALAQHNSQIIPDPKRMKPGVTIATPSADALERAYSQLIPKAAPIGPAQSVDSFSTTTDEPSEESSFFVSTEGSPMYRVGKEDTLSDIAQRHLGRSSRWVQIFEMNRDVLADGNSLKIGTLLRLPADASRVDVVSQPRTFR